MPKLNPESAKKSLLHRMRKQRLKYITILPSLITLLNGLFGFAAIVLASKPAVNDKLYEPMHIPYFAMAAYFLIFAMIADMLDGRVARMSQSTSSFGGQLDSICDIISFGVAPAFLMFKMLEFKLSMLELNPAFKLFLERFIWFAAATYISCAAIRLARFNVENEEDESAHMSFVGLPSPAAAGVIISLVIFQQQTIKQIALGGALEVYKVTQDVILYILPLVTIAAGILMISRIRYPHVINQYLKGKKPFAHFVRVLIFFGLIIFLSWQAAAVIISCGFALSGVIRWILKKNRENENAPSTEPLTDSSADEANENELDQ